jgi:hypothetical protein
MTALTVAGVIGASTTLLGTLGGFVVAVRRSSADSDDHWQDLVRSQLAAQIGRNEQLDQRITRLWTDLDTERSERRRVEAGMASRIALLESTLRTNGIAVPPI